MDMPEKLLTCPDSPFISICKCTEALRINATSVGEFVRTCNNGLYKFGSRCDRCVCAVTYSHPRNLDVVETTIRKAVENNTPIPILIRQIQAIGPAANLFFTRLNDVLKQSLSPLQDHWVGVGVGLSVGTTILIGYWYLRGNTMILGRRSSADGTGHEYLFQSRFPFRGNAWYAASSLSAASRELAIEFDTIIQTPKEIVAKRAVDHNGNESEVDRASGLQYLVRSEGGASATLRMYGLGSSSWRRISGYGLWCACSRWTLEMRGPSCRLCRVNGNSRLMGGGHEMHWGGSCRGIGRLKGRGASGIRCAGFGLGMR